MTNHNEDLLQVLILRILVRMHVNGIVLARLIYYEPMSLFCKSWDVKSKLQGFKSLNLGELQTVII